VEEEGNWGKEVGEEKSNILKRKRMEGKKKWKKYRNRKRS